MSRIVMMFAVVILGVATTTSARSETQNSAMGWVGKIGRFKIPKVELTRTEADEVSTTVGVPLQLGNGIIGLTPMQRRQAQATAQKPVVIVSAVSTQVALAEPPH
jgi:hypothetical protein